MKAPKQKKQYLKGEGMEDNTCGMKMERQFWGEEAGDAEGLEEHWKNQSKLSMFENVI